MKTETFEGREGGWGLRRPKSNRLARGDKSESEATSKWSERAHGTFISRIPPILPSSGTLLCQLSLLLFIFLFQRAIYFLDSFTVK